MSSMIFAFIAIATTEFLSICVFASSPAVEQPNTTAGENASFICRASSPGSYRDEAKYRIIFGWTTLSAVLISDTASFADSAWDTATATLDKPVNRIIFSSCRMMMGSSSECAEYLSGWIPLTISFVRAILINLGSPFDSCSMIVSIICLILPAIGCTSPFDYLYSSP